MKKRSDGKRPSESFVLGVIALVFLIIGYQTAMFVYRAAVMKIVANRDEPDTVFVYQAVDETQVADRLMQSELQSGGDEVGIRGRGISGVRTSETVNDDRRQYVRKNAEHSPVAETVRQNLPRKRVESFRFNPNTASHDDFCRLGFTPKQAQSIINYRVKGGSYRRKSDFAKSFVVSDSIYRRLEKYIDIPLLDLNLADSADFDALPGIGGWFASKLISYRNQLKGYSYKEQLLEIWKFDEQKFAALEDLVTINPETATPYPLWTYPVDSLRKHPYIKNYETARAIVLFRETMPRESWTVDALRDAGILPHDSADKLKRCLIE